MTTFTSQEIQELITYLNRNVDVQTWTKPQVMAALQAIEDRVRAPATFNTISNDIETATPGVFDTNQKYLLFGVWCVTAARRLGVI